VRRNVAIGVVLTLMGVSVLFLGTVLPWATRRFAGVTTEYESLPVWVTFSAFALLLSGAILLAVELTADAVVEEREGLRNHSQTSILIDLLELLTR
jgi:hypothetical protein